MKSADISNIAAVNLLLLSFESSSHTACAVEPGKTSSSEGISDPTIDHPQPMNLISCRVLVEVA